MNVPDDDPDYENRACEVCGATTDDEAGKLCRPYQIPSGEYVCDGHPEEESYSDGRLRFMSPHGIASVNAWVDEQVALDRAMRSALASGVAVVAPPSVEESIFGERRNRKQRRAGKATRRRMKGGR